MRIGILTFHWAVNFGAVLQAYALQLYLESTGHEVEIIDYKPRSQDMSVSACLKNPRKLISFLAHFRTKQHLLIKDSRLETFRKQYLHLSKHCCSFDEVNSLAKGYDVLISGSDQVLNPSFTLLGDAGPTSTYYLNFNCNALKIGYAVSFGCASYPETAKQYAQQWITSFDKIGVRERTGLNILTQLGIQGPHVIVPDPTLLCGNRLFSKLELKIVALNYTYVYLLHGRVLSDNIMRAFDNLRYADANVRSISMQNWLENIASSSFFITNSYHGMIMAILFHVPFAVLLEDQSRSGMNDRFSSLLDRIGLMDRIVDDDCMDNVVRSSIDWYDVDEKVAQYRKIGESFLSFENL